MTLLDPGSITVDGILFTGATLWTDVLLKNVTGEAWAHLNVGEGLAEVD